MKTRDAKNGKTYMSGIGGTYRANDGDPQNDVDDDEDDDDDLSERCYYDYVDGITV